MMTPDLPPRFCTRCRSHQRVQANSRQVRCTRCGSLLERLKAPEGPRYVAKGQTA